MEKNNKLDKLLQAARETKPVIDFEEASGMIKTSAAGTTAITSSATKGMIAAISAIVLAVAGYFIFSNSETPVPQPQNTVAAPAEQAPVVAEQPAAEPAPQAAVETSAPKEAAPEKATTPEKVVAKSDAENVGIKFTEVKSNTLRTVTITGDAGTFKVKFAGDDLKEILLNNEAVAEDKWDNYKDVIAQAHSTISSHKTADAGNDTNDKNFMNDLKNQLVKDGLINGNVTSLQFNKTGLLINGTAVDAATHKRYLDFYKAQTGKDIGATNFSIKGSSN